VTAWIGEWPLLGVGLALHALSAVSLRVLRLSAERGGGFGTRGVESA